MSNDFFSPRPASRPTIYAYEDKNPQIGDADLYDNLNRRLFVDNWETSDE